MRHVFSRKLLFLGIVLLAAVLRFWQLGEVPKGFHGDEASYGYNAYSILLTGKDEHAESFPIILKSWGEYKPALYSYLDIPFIAVFGLNPFSVRIVAAIFGVLTVLLIYFLANKLFSNPRIALLSSFLLAISPWHITLSRTVSEVVVSVFFILLLVYAASYLKDKFHKWWFVLSLCSGIFAMWSYTASRFFVVLICILLILFSIKIIKSKFHINRILLLLCFLFIAVGAFFSSIDSTARFSQVSITSSPETKLLLEEQIREDQYSPTYITRMYHNKIVNYARTMSMNYSEYFTADFLFLNGGYPYRVKIPDSGLFYLWQIPFLLIGVCILLSKRSRKGFFLIAWWGLLLLPAALTFDEIPNVYRSLVILPPMLIIIAIGIHTFLSNHSLNKFITRLILALLVVIGIWELLYFQHQYYIHHELHRPWYRESAYEPLSESLKELSPAYKKIVMTKSQGGPYISLLFWSKYDPATYHSEGSPMNNDYTGFGKYYFVPEDCPLRDGYKEEEKIVLNTQFLYINKGDCPLPLNGRLLKTIYWQDNNPAFRIFDYIDSHKPDPAKAAKG